MGLGSAVVSGSAVVIVAAGSAQSLDRHAHYRTCRLLRLDLGSSFVVDAVELEVGQIRQMSAVEPLEVALQH